SVSNFSGSGTTYTFDVTPTADGAVDVDIAGGAATDTAGNSNTAATTLSRTFDGTAPTVTTVTPNLTSIVDSHAGTGTFTLTVDFSEAMNPSVNPTLAFPTEDPSNTLSFNTGSWSDSDTYIATYDITDANDAIADIDVQVSGAQDTAGNTQTVSTQADEFSIAMASTVAFSAATFAAVENIGTSNAVTLTRTGDTSGTATVQVTLTGGTATGSGTDYTSTSFPLTVTFDANETSQAIALPITDDDLVEETETLTLSLTSPSNASVGTQATTTLSITDNDVATLAIANAQIAEGTGGNTQLVFDVTLTGDVDTGVTVDFATANVTGSAVAGTDYTAQSDTLTFAGTDGETQQITIDVTPDTLVELDETFEVTLSNVQASGRNVTISQATATGTIQDDDVATIAIANAQIVEGTGGNTQLVFDVTLTGDVDTGVTVDFATANVTGSAVAGTDYTTQSDTLTFTGTDGETQQITIDMTPDALVELDETFEVMLSNVQAAGYNVAISQTTATGTIINDDQAIVSIAATTNGAEPDTDGQFTVSLSNQSDINTVISYTVSGTAATAADYTALSGEVTFLAGETNTTIDVEILDDTLTEPTETLVIDLENVTTGRPTVAIDANNQTTTISIFDEDSIAPEQGIFTFEQYVLLEALEEGRSVPFTEVSIGGIPIAKLFDETYYLANNPGVAAAVSQGAFSSGYDHFVTFGWQEGRNPSSLYDEAFYLLENTDVADAVNAGVFQSGFEHFIQFGHIENRDPSALFDADDYLLSNLDVANAVSESAFSSGFQHFVMFGSNGNRLPNLLLFDETIYLTENPNVANGVTIGFFESGLEHYLLFGQGEGRNPSGIFDENSYLALNPNVAAAVNAGIFASGFEHYIEFGRAEGRDVTTPY
ncbi:MAG: hypothetical protein F6K42_22095, partial [Leptolyngbya sp. SIO1D8]|nr:hypothetical protein [Leptolyngbya sp. SIO1D8]